MILFLFFYQNVQNFIFSGQKKIDCAYLEYCKCIILGDTDV